MVEGGGGRILSILSNLINNPVVPYHDYTTAKSALLGFSRNLAAELGPHNITVNMVAGGLIDETDASASTTEEVRRGSSPAPRPCGASAPRRTWRGPSSCSPHPGRTSSRAS